MPTQVQTPTHQPSTHVQVHTHTHTLPTNATFRVTLAQVEVMNEAATAAELLDSRSVCVCVCVCVCADHASPKRPSVSSLSIDGLHPPALLFDADSGLLAGQGAFVRPACTFLIHIHLLTEVLSDTY